MDQQPDAFDRNVKVVLVGPSMSGKTQLMTTFVNGTVLGTHQPTIGVDLECKVVQVDNRSIRVQVWDLAGQERFRAVATAYLRGAHAVLGTLNLQDRAQLDQVDPFIEALHAHYVDAPILLLGTFADASEERQISEEQGREVADKLGAAYMELSTLDPERVEAAFVAVLTAAVTSQPVVLPAGISGDDNSGSVGAASSSASR